MVSRIIYKTIPDTGAWVLIATAGQGVTFSATMPGYFALSDTAPNDDTPYMALNAMKEREIAPLPADLYVKALSGGGQVVGMIATPGAKTLPDGGGVFQVGTTQKKWADDFGGTTLDTALWQEEMNVGGMTYSVGSSNLVVNMNTNINAELRLLSKEVFTIPFDVSVAATLSQRIANNSVFFEAVEVDPDTLLPIDNANLAGDWRNRAAINIDGTSATTAKLDTIGSAANALLSTSATITTTAALVDLLMELRPQDIVVTSVVSNSANAKSTAAHRNSTNIPDPNKLYKIRLRFKNGGTAPASNTVVTVARVLVADVQEIAVEVASGRGDQAPGKGIAVNIANASLPGLGAGTQNVGSVGGNIMATTGGIASVSKLLSAAASGNPISVKAAAGRLYKVKGYNASASVRFLKFFNKASAPTLGTDTPVFTIALAPSKEFELDFGLIGYYFGTGIALAITGAVADNDNTALTAGDIVGMSTFYA